MNDRKNGLPGSIQVGGFRGIGLGKTPDYQKMVDGCIQDEARFSLLLKNCTCPKTRSYAKEKIEKIGDPQKRQKFLNLI